MPNELKRLCGRGKAHALVAGLLGGLVLVVCLLGLLGALATPQEAVPCEMGVRYQQGDYLAITPEYASKNLRPQSSGDGYYILFWWDDYGLAGCVVRGDEQLDRALTDLQNYTYFSDTPPSHYVTVRGAVTSLPDSLRQSVVDEYNYLVAEGDATLDNLDELLCTFCLDTGYDPLNLPMVLLFGLPALAALVWMVLTIGRRRRVNRQTKHALSMVSLVQQGAAARQLTSAQPYPASGMYLGTDFLYGSAEGLVLVPRAQIREATVRHGGSLPGAKGRAARANYATLELHMTNGSMRLLPWQRCTLPVEEELEQLARLAPDAEGAAARAAQTQAAAAAAAGTAYGSPAGYPAGSQPQPAAPGVVPGSARDATAAAQGTAPAYARPAANPPQDPTQTMNGVAGQPMPAYAQPQPMNGGQSTPAYRQPQTGNATTAGQGDAGFPTPARPTQDSDTAVPQWAQPVVQVQDISGGLQVEPAAAHNGMALQPNFGRGVLGTLLGCLLGGALWVLIGAVADIFSAWVGLLIIWLALTFHKKFAGGLDKRGALVSMALAILTIFPATFLVYVCGILTDFTFGEACALVWQVMRTDATIWGNMALALGLTLLVGIPMCRRVLHPEIGLQNVPQGRMQSDGTLLVTPPAGKAGLVSLYIISGLWLVIGLAAALTDGGVGVTVMMLGLGALCMALALVATRRSKNLSINCDENGLRWTDGKGRRFAADWGQVTELRLKNPLQMRIVTLQGKIDFNQSWSGGLQLRQLADAKAVNATRR